jgi:outer membrane lipopolysaccharide assembly protein LptE/RlpB
LKTAIRCALFAVLLCLAACGYRNPYVYNGPDKTIYITDWKNRTSELGINTKLYQTLMRWFQKSGSLHISSERQGADLILAGEIKSIYLPSRSYGSNRTAVEGRMYLTVRYILKDLQSDTVLLEEQNHTFSKDYLISNDSTVTRNNEDDAIDQALEDLSQKLYQRCLVEIPKLEAKRQAEAQGK